MNSALLFLTLDAAAVALALLVPISAVALRVSRGERWEVPLTWSPELEGILPAPGQAGELAPQLQAAD